MCRNCQLGQGNMHPVSTNSCEINYTTWKNSLESAD